MTKRKSDPKTNQAADVAAPPQAGEPPPSFAEHAQATLETIATNLGIPADELTLEPAPPEPREAGRIRLSLPFGELNPRHFHKRHVDLQLNSEQAKTLARIQKELRGQPYELTADGTDFRRDGRIIDGPAKVFYWLLNGATLLMKQADDAKSSGESERA
jgi:hypothetical protein